MYKLVGYLFVFLFAAMSIACAAPLVMAVVDMFFWYWTGHKVTGVEYSGVRGLIISFSILALLFAYLTLNMLAALES